MKNTKSNLNKLTATIIILLIAGFMAPLSTTMASNGNGLSPEEQVDTANNNNNSTEIPSTNSDNQTTNGDIINSDNCENTRQYNRTDVTPKNQTELVRALEQTMFQYRNMTMLMNCTRNCTVTFTADEEVTPKVLGLTVDPNQTMTLAMNLTKSPLNGAMVNERCLNFYLGIEPNATMQLQAQIRLHINQTELSSELNREVNASRLTWMFWNQTRAQCQAVESYMDQNGYYLVCNTNHFSTWTVAETENNEGAITEQTDALPSILVVAGPITAIVLVIAIALIYKKRK
jgi:hypothetical protein